MEFCRLSEDLGEFTRPQPHLINSNVNISDTLGDDRAAGVSQKVAKRVRSVVSPERYAAHLC